MATRMMARSLVGRDAQLAELEAAVGAAADGRPSFVFVAGEPGLGKTRLLDELTTRLRHDGTARCLSGDCVALGEGELPYAPLVGALRPLARAADPVLDLLPGATRAALAMLVPALAGPGAAPPPITPDDAGAQARVFEALLELLDALCTQMPVVLVVEDLHWADASTRAFLRFLAVSLCRERVLVVGSFRPDELHRRHPLRPLLAELERDPRTRRITLEPFSRAELAAQLTDIQGTPPDDGLLERLHRRSEGNPLFTEELIAAGPDGRGGLPPTLRDALTVRIQRLSDEAQELLRLVALARSADHQTLAAAAGLPSRVLADALREATGAQILTVDADERYRFRHALLREAVGDDLLPGERGELHLTLARALEAAPGPGRGVYRATAVAYHYAAAGDQPAALTASVRAAEAALSVHAFGEAAQLLDRALELWDRVPDAAQLTGTTEVGLLERAAHAGFDAGDHRRVQTLLERALDLVGDEDPIAASRLLDRLVRSRWNENRQHDTLSLLEKSMELLPAGPSSQRAWRLTSKARYLMLMGRYREAGQAARAAAAMAEATGSTRAHGNAVNVLGVSLAALGDVEAGAGALRQAASIARQTESFGDLARAAVNLSDVLHLAGRTGEAIAVAEEVAAEGDALAQHGTWLRIGLAEFLIDAGRWEEADVLLVAIGTRHQGTTLVNVLLRLGELALARGDAAASEHLERACRHGGGSREPQFIAVLHGLLAEHLVRAGDLPAARRAIDDGLDRIEFCTEDVPRLVRLAADGVRVEADLAQHARDTHDAAGVTDAVARAAALLERVTVSVEPEDGAVRPVERAHWLTAAAEYARATDQSSSAAWAQAADAWTAVGRPYPAAQATWREAEAHVRAGDRDGAGVAAARALTTAQRLGSAWLADELRTLIARARLRQVEDAPPAHAGSAPTADGAADPFGLTARERQVLALVAEGATNREVGATLFMAEKTASVHVSRILAKLDVRSRTEAAAVAHRLGLAGGGSRQPAT